MNFSEIGLKDLVLDFDSNDLQDITIVQGDTKTRGFKVLVSTNSGEIIKASSQYEMRLYGVNSNYPDKSFFTKGVIDGDFYKVYISTDMASKSGKLQLQLALFEGTNALIQSRIKEVDVYRSIANGGNVGKDLVVDFGKLNKALEIAEKQQKKFEESLVRQQAVESKIAEKHTEVVQIRDGLKDVLTTENARVEAEKKRVSAEDVRATNESTRQSNEQQRQSNETARQQKESTRESNETQRQAEESTRKSDEQKRISAETNRNSEESKRDNAEKIRIENENKRISAENKRAENDTTYNKNEQQRQAQESTRQTQEQQRVDEEKLRQSQEDTRKQSEDTRQSQESTRQSQEQSRVDAESKRATSETTREESEQTRTSKETERQNAEQTRQSNEKTRVSQENSRVEAEKKRAKAESDRAGKFAGWDKTMQGVIPTATSTVAGIVRIDVDGESTAVSKKSFDENVRALYEAYGGTLNDVNTMFTETNVKIDAKADKTDVDNLKEKLNEKADVTYIDSKIEQSENTISDNFGRLYGPIIESNSDKVSDLSKKHSTLEKNVTASLDSLNAQMFEKADKKHTHTTTDITDLETVLSTKASKEDVDKLSTELTEKVDNFKVEAATSKTAGIVKIDVDGEDTAVSKKTYEEDIKKIVKNFGGRNYLLNSNISVTNADYPMISYKLSEKPIVGETYTLTIWGKLGDGKKGFRIFNSGGTVALAEGEYLRKLKEGLYQLSFKWVNKNVYGVADDSELTIYPEYNSVKVESTINKIKLEKGTNWTPSPEDLIISDVVTNITVIQSGASTTSIPANTLIFEKE